MEGHHPTCRINTPLLSMSRFSAARMSTCAVAAPRKEAIQKGALTCTMGLKSSLVLSTDHNWCNESRCYCQLPNTIFVLSFQNHDIFGKSNKLLKGCKHKADILYAVSVNVRLHAYTHIYTYIRPFSS